MTSRSRGAATDAAHPPLRDPEAMMRSVTSAALADVVFASHARTYREANPGSTHADFVAYVTRAAVQDLGQALPNPANLAMYAAFLVANVGPVMAAVQSGAIGGFRPSVQPAIVQDRFDGVMKIE